MWSSSLLLHCNVVGSENLLLNGLNDPLIMECYDFALARTDSQEALLLLLEANLQTVLQN